MPSEYKLNAPAPSGVIGWRVGADNQVTPISAPPWVCPVCGRGMAPHAIECRCHDEQAHREDEQEMLDTEEWFQVAKRYDVDDGPLAHFDILRAVLDDLRDRESLQEKAIQLDTKTLELQRNKLLLEEKLQLCEGRVAGLLEGAAKTGSLAPMVLKARELAEVLGFEQPPNAEQIGDVLEQAQLQIVMCREAVKSLRADLAKLRDRID